ncbi:MAG: hypothetical protein OEZ21_08865 [Candidatus Bathyarchaeota archaeon]|nr:hypothetical protein [Candidatus Bathyarchaeota archaeon]
MGKHRKEWLKPTAKREKAVLSGVCLGFVLMGFALFGAAFAEPWFSESRYAYFIGDVDSWDEEGAEGMVCVYPENSCIGDEPGVVVSFERALSHVTCYSKSAMFHGSMVNISMVAFDYNGADFYMSGTFKIRANILVIAENITDVTAFVAELCIADIAIITTESNITDIVAFIADSTTAEITVFYVTEENSVFVENYTAVIIDDVVVGDFDAVISHTVFYGDTIFVATTKQNSGCVPGELYVTGDWTDFAVEIEGFGMLSGKVLDYDVKNDGTVSVARTDVNHNRKIDIHDVAKVARAYGSTVGSSLYDPDLDFNSDSIINIVDLAAVARNFGKTY